MQHTAVIIVDMQEFFLKKFPSKVREEFLANQRKVIGHCVKNKMPFFLLEYNAGGIARGTTVPELGRIIGGVSIEKITKESNSGFTNTELDATLRAMNIKKIVLMGINANGCVQDTAMGALRRGYEVITSAKIVASTSRKDLSFSRKNKAWFSGHLIFFENPDELMRYFNK